MRTAIASIAVTACCEATDWTVAAVKNRCGVQIPNTMTNRASRYSPLKLLKPRLILGTVTRELIS